MSLSSISIEHSSSKCSMKLRRLDSVGPLTITHTLTTSSIDGEKQPYCGSKSRCFFKRGDWTVGKATECVGMSSQEEAQLDGSLRAQKESRLEAKVNGSDLWIANSFPKSARKRRFTCSRISEMLHILEYTQRLTVSYTDIHCHKVGFLGEAPKFPMDDISKPCATDWKHPNQNR